MRKNKNDTQKIIGIILSILLTLFFSPDLKIYAEESQLSSGIVHEGGLNKHVCDDNCIKRTEVTNTITQDVKIYKGTSTGTGYFSKDTLGFNEITGVTSVTMAEGSPRDLKYKGYTWDANGITVHLERSSTTSSTFTRSVTVKANGIRISKNCTGTLNFHECTSACKDFAFNQNLTSNISIFEEDSIEIIAGSNYLVEKGGTYKWQMNINNAWIDIATATTDGNVNANSSFQFKDYITISAKSDKTTSIKIDADTDGINGKKIRCIAYDAANANIRYSEESTINIMPLSFASLDVIYPNKKINIGKSINTSELYIKCIYNSGNSDVFANYQGLTFDNINAKYGEISDNGTILTLTKLGDAEITVNVPFKTTSYTAKFTVTVEDTEPPLIESIDYADIPIKGGIKDTIAPFEISVTVNAKDNNRTDTLLYAITEKKNNIDESALSYQYSNKFMLTLNDNIVYVIYAKDSANNITTEDVEFYIRDDEAPKILKTELLYQEIEWHCNNIISIIANDNITSKEKLEYRFCNSKQETLQDWSTMPAYLVRESGTYYVEVKDEVNNISVKTIVVTNIDGDAPIIEPLDTIYDDKGEKATLSAKVKDAMSGVYQYSFDGVQYSNITTDADTSGLEYTITKDNVPIETYKSGKLTLYVTDKAGNKNHFTFQMTEKPNAPEDTSAPIVTASRLTDFGNGYLKEVKYLIEYEYDKEIATRPYGIAKWKDDKEPLSPVSWGVNAQFTLNTGGTYRAFVKAKNGNVGYTDFTVSDVDNDPASIEWKNIVWDWENKTATFQIKITDSDSGIDYIVFNGGSLMTNNQYDGVGYTGESEVELEETVTLYANATYSIYVTDLAGNQSTYKVTCDENGNMIIQSVIVTFKDYDGTIIDTQIISAGTNAKEPKAPTRNDYTFKGWDKSLNNIKEDTTITALYEEVAYTYYTVTFNDYDGTFISQDKVRAGADATPPSKPKRKGYKFKGWDKAYTNVTSNITVKAIYEADEDSDDDEDNVTYKVTFQDYNGEILKTQTVERNDSATAPNAPTRKGYAFTGWDKSYNSVKTDLVVTAQYAKIEDTDESSNDANSKNLGTNGTGGGNGSGRGGSGTSNGNIEDMTEEATTEEAIDELEEENEDVIPLSTLEVDATKLQIDNGQYDKMVSDTDEMGEGEDEEIEVKKEVYEMEQTNDSADSKKASKEKTLSFYLSITFLIGFFGFSIFYILNKKKGWVNLPAIAFFDELPFVKKM